MSRKILPFLAALFFFMGLPACAQESAQEKKVRAAVEKTLNTDGRNFTITSVKRTGYLGLYEVALNGEEIIYVDEKVSAILAGNLIDAKTMRSVTAERMAELSAAQFASLPPLKFSDLPLDQAIKQVRGDGKRLLATFEDPNCGYCKRLAQELLQLDNITHYVFMMPVLSEDSMNKSRQIWCAPDRGKAWNDYMVNNSMPAGAGDCDTSAIERNMELGRTYQISGTPTLFFANGERVPGALPTAQIEAKMNQLQK
ncbi:MAG: DsbC family protein [Betaproteobacteria bacterium]|nr:DsbC family protein [Betaproteobacteria bacterium]